MNTAQALADLIRTTEAARACAGSAAAPPVGRDASHCSSSSGRYRTSALTLMKRGPRPSSLQRRSAARLTCRCRATSSSVKRLNITDSLIVIGYHPFRLCPTFCIDTNKYTYRFAFFVPACNHKIRGPETPTADALDPNLGISSGVPGTLEEGHRYWSRRCCVNV